MNPRNEIDTSYVPTPQDFQEEELDLGYYLAVLAESKWLILLVTLLVLLAGMIYIWRATPLYQVDALIQVEENKKSAQSAALGDVLGPLLMGETAVSAELQILGSRMVLGKVVDNLQLAVSAGPVYFPVIGSAIARSHNHPAAGLAEPWFGLKQYAWGGEAIKVKTFDVPTANQGDTFILEAGEQGRYRLLGPKGVSDLSVVLEGKVGEMARAELNGEPLRLFVSELKARPGTHFNLVHNDRLSVINGLDKALKMAEEGRKSGVISVKLTGPNPVLASTIVNEVANVYLRQNVERRSAEAAQTLSFLQQQLPAMKKNLETSETSLNAYRLQHGSVDLPKEVELVLAKIVDAEQQTIQLKQKREELIRRFTPAHPTIAALDAQLASYNKQLNDLTQ